MNRRTFITCCGSSLLLPLPAMADSAATGQVPLLYDERFAQAIWYTQQITAHDSYSRPVPTRGDVTLALQLMPGLAASGRPLHLTGVTTEAFHFCLQRLLRERGRVQGTVERLDPDLYLWSLSCHHTTRRSS